MNQYDRECAMKEQEAAEEMIRMRHTGEATTVQPAAGVIRLPRGDILAQGPVNRMGERDGDGSYVLLLFAIDGAKTQRCRVSRGQAELLAAEIHNILTLDLDRLTGAVIDAYTLAPNDEEAKREGVRAALERGVRP